MPASQPAHKPMPQPSPIYDAVRQAHRSCMICGSESDSLGLAFVRLGEAGVTADFMAERRHQGYDGLLHGGMICTLLDAAMVHCLFAHGVAALTAEMTVRFVAPIKIGRQVTLAARLVDKRRGIYRVGGTLSDDGQVLARASAKFVEPERPR